MQTQTIIRRYNPDDMNTVFSEILNLVKQSRRKVETSLICGSIGIRNIQRFMREKEFAFVFKTMSFPADSLDFFFAEFPFKLKHNLELDNDSLINPIIYKGYPLSSGIIKVMVEGKILMEFLLQIPKLERGENFVTKEDIELIEKYKKNWSNQYEEEDDSQG